MLRRILFFVGSVLCFVGGCSAIAATPVEHISYKVDLEKSVIAKSPDYTVNYSGIIDDTTAGKKCYKLDFVFTTKSCLELRISLPKRIPAEGCLRLTGRVFLSNDTDTGGVEINPSYSYPPSTPANIAPMMCSANTKGDWQSVQGDLVQYARKVNLKSYDWGNPELSNTGAYLDCLLIRVYGLEGHKMTAYLDDFKIEGDVPAASDYDAEIIQRWVPVKSKIDKQITKWNLQLSQTTREINGMKARTKAGGQAKEDILAKVSMLEKRVEKIQARGSVCKDEQREIDNNITWLSNVKQKPNTAALIYNLGNAGLFITTVSPISSIPVQPTGIYGALSNRINISAARGEYEPASFVVHALRDTNDLTVKVSELEQGDQVIPASNIDVKVVKCWYQAGSAWYGIDPYRGARVIVPELMLNDDSLVKVDRQKQENYLKLSFPSESKYVWISDPNESMTAIGKSKSIKEYPVKDSPVLLPVDILAHENKQFWITVKTPDNAKPGMYSGKIRINSANGDSVSLDLNLKVLPFNLPKPYYDSSIYYRSVIDPTGVGSISSEQKSKKQLEVELKDLVAHGVTNPTVYQGFDNKDLLKQYLAFSHKAGINNDPLYYLGINTLADIGRIKEVIDFAHTIGISQVYIYGRDEATDDALIAQRKQWEEIHKIGGKVFVAGYKSQNFAKMGDIQDLFVCAYYPSKEEADKWHSVHHKIWCYLNPQGGVENPDVYRRNFGLLLWKTDYDGACTYAYQHGFRNIWNDFDDLWFRDHCFTYPTVDGVIDTIAWEGYREGVDDIRYLTKLQKLISDTENSNDKKQLEIVHQAKQYLATINIDNDDLYYVRAKMIGYISGLSKEK